jgi:hypothetical protein
MFLALLFIIQIALAAPSDYPCNNEPSYKEKIVAIGACHHNLCAVKTNKGNTTTKRLIPFEDAFIGDEIEVLKPKCASSGYELYLEHAKKTGRNILSPSDWEARKEENLKKYGKERRFIAK